MLQKARWSEGNSNGQVRQESRQEPDEGPGDKGAMHCSRSYQSLLCYDHQRCLPHQKYLRSESNVDSDQINSM